ncbi:hypothetical protein [Dyella sp. ASV21]|uniref:hypothetical protein n=1 Tax=Dyella sp. ASV21 TaxID=2795114 RepID=UPI0018EE2F73|nr:hypothetical protein [Dyella sp. ASV21]
MKRQFERAGDLRAHISTMVLCCGRGFPAVGEYRGDLEKDTDLAFQELRSGRALLAKKVKDEAKIHQIDQLIEDSLAAYKQGDRKKGAFLLQDILDVAFPRRFIEYAARKGEPL